MSSGNSSSFSMPQNQEKKQIPRYEVRFTNKNHPFMWLVCKTRAKILLSDPQASLTTPRLLPLSRSRRSYGNYRSPQSPGSSRNILKRLGRSYGNQALLIIHTKNLITTTNSDSARVLVHSTDWLKQTTTFEYLCQIQTAFSRPTLSKSFS